MDRGEEVDIELPNVVDVGEEDGVREPETKFSYGPYVVDYGTLVVVFLLSGVNRFFFFFFFFSFKDLIPHLFSSSLNSTHFSPNNTKLSHKIIIIII